jgi:hypothetical protein
VNLQLRMADFCGIAGNVLALGEEADLVVLS